MDDWGAGMPWHVLEEVPPGRELIPGLLDGLLVAAERRTSWARLEERLGWSTGSPYFAPAAARLFELLPELDRHHRRRVLDFLARRAHRLTTKRWRVDQQTLAAFVDGRPRVVSLLSDPDPGIRTCAAWFLGEMPGDDTSSPDALRGQAAVETDSTALQSQLLALGTLSASGAVTEEGWFQPWRGHPDALVRLAAVKAMLPVVTTAGVAGLGHVAGNVFAEIGITTLPDVPWWPHGRELINGIADPLQAHPQEAVELVRALSRAPKADPRRAAVVAARSQLRYWRRPAAGLWETVVAGLDDEDQVASAALDVLAEGGSAVAPYADRLIRFVEERATPANRATAVDKALQALVGAADDRALPGCQERSGSHWLRVGALLAQWAPELLPVLRERLGSGPEAHGIAEVLDAIDQWDPPDAPGVPELIELLDTSNARYAAEALGRIGPPAEAAAGPLARLARGDLRPPRDLRTDREPRRWHGAQTAAWAHWRVTGDPELALDVIGSAARTGLGRPVLSHLADLGPLAASYADALRPLLGCPGEWSRVGAAEAWWRVTGDAATAVDVLLPELQPLGEHRSTPLVLRTVQALGGIGRPAVAAVPLLKTVMASERRYGGNILMDERLCRAAQETLDRID
ncbi:hypothetical protein [Streptomyces sp. NPDC008139]|uniref:hypothetical protein n=1 Tax=Streptomyces sp. NPDC008139 TaxID=3364814 RepID=UPI0036ECEBB4